MLTQRAVCFFCITMFFQVASFAAEKEIVLTIDDLPFVGANNSNERFIKRSNERIHAIIDTLVQHKVPATGFMIGDAMAKEQMPLLEEMKAGGFSLGNHTYSHKNLNYLSAEKYIADIDKADKKMQDLMTEPKYFRYPYLAEGNGAKKQAVLDYLAAHHYTVAPVTIDSKDYNFNAQLLSVNWRNREAAVNSIKKRYLAFIQKQILRAESIDAKKGSNTKHILLVHANLLNSYCLGEVIDLFQKNGYVFVPLDKAIAARNENPASPAAIEKAEKQELQPSARSSKNENISNYNLDELSDAIETLFKFFG